jgi:hypothetical protein
MPPTRLNLAEAYNATTPLQRAISCTVGGYRDALRSLMTHREREALRDVLCAVVARDYLEANGLFRGAEEARAA